MSTTLHNLPTVQLRHLLPDGSAHIDWMIATDIAGSGPLITFRLPGRLDALAPGERLRAERINDHRPAYLHYEGPVSGDRGEVVRVARGVVLRLDMDEAIWSVSVRWGAREHADDVREQRLRLVTHDLDRWTVVLDPVSLPNVAQ